jgi:hypothetical protein
MNATFKSITEYRYTLSPHLTVRNAVPKTGWMHVLLNNHRSILHNLL